MQKKSNEIKEQMSVGAGAIAGMPTATPPEQTPVGLGKKFKVLRRKTLEGKKTITTKAVGYGMHEVYVNGEKHNDLSIISGSAGVSGYGRNLYGVYSEKANKPTWVGSLGKTREKVEQLVNEMDEVPAAGPASGATPIKATNINTNVRLKKFVKIKPFKSIVNEGNDKPVLGRKERAVRAMKSAAQKQTGLVSKIKAARAANKAFQQKYRKEKGLSKGGDFFRSAGMPHLGTLVDVLRSKKK